MNPFDWPIDRRRSRQGAHKITKMTVRISGNGVEGLPSNGYLTIMDTKFVQRVLMETLNELKINALAMVRGRSVRVRELARSFFECYSANHIHISTLMQSRHMKFSLEPESGECSFLNNLRNASPRSFDRIYIEMVARRQRETISLARAELQEGRDPEVRQVASSLLYQLEKHLENAIGVMKTQPC